MKKQIKKFLAVICTAVMAAGMFSGCSSVGLNDGELLQPPKATGEKAEIQNVIDSTVGTDYTLLYPQNGDYRSAIIMQDLTGDGNEEAIVIYRTNSDSTTTSLLFIDHTDTGWHAVRSFNNKNFDVDSVYISDIDNDGQKEVIVGWSSFIGATNQMTYYKNLTGDVQQYTVDATYSNMAIGDLTGDGVDDMILLSPVTQQSKTATARLYTFSYENNKQQMNMLGEVYTNPNVTQYINVQIGKVDENTLGLFLDGSTASNQTMSEVIYYDKVSSTLADPLNVKGNMDITTNITTRNTAAVCRDINGDGITDVPQEAVMEGSAPQNSTESLASLNLWSKFNTSTKQLDNLEYTVASYADGYYFSIPALWQQKVTVTSDTASKTMKIYSLDRPQKTDTQSPTQAETNAQEAPTAAATQASTVAQTGQLLLTIKVFTENDWQTANDGSFNVAANSNGYVYAVKLADNLSADYALTLEQVSSCIKFI